MINQKSNVFVFPFNKRAPTLSTNPNFGLFLNDISWGKIV